ncbi:autotransporter family protein [Bartonella sp. CB175]|uniref:autotransporter family protein n=1 Tax=Bartonella sp. CB175 TaxID=3112256 RepID=UPI00300E37AA
MIKVFKNRVRLCTFTTAILSVLQNGIWGYAHAEEAGYKITVQSAASPYPPHTEYPTHTEYPAHAEVFVFPTSYDPGSAGVHIDGRVVLDNEDSRDYNNYGGGGDDGVEDGKESSLIEYDVYDGQYFDDGRTMSYYYWCQNCGNKTIHYQKFVMNLKNSVSKNNPNKIAITVTGSEKAESITNVTGDNVVIFSQDPGVRYKRGVSVSLGAEANFFNLNMKDAEVGLHASRGVISVDGGVIESIKEVGVQAIGVETLILLENVAIRMGDTFAWGNQDLAAIYSAGGAYVVMDGGVINFPVNHGVLSSNGVVLLNNAMIMRDGINKNQKDNAAFLVERGGFVQFKEGVVTIADAHGILMRDTPGNSGGIRGLVSQNVSLQLEEENILVTSINMDNSTVHVKGSEHYGIYFQKDPRYETFEHGYELYTIPHQLSFVELKDTQFFVEKVGVFGTNFTDGVVVLNKSVIDSDDLLLKAEEGASVRIYASDRSALKGGSYVDNHASSSGEVYLSNQSVWILQAKPLVRNEISVNSYISFVSLEDSSIDFLAPAPNSYQTLYIGNGSGTVYEAKGNARISIRTYLNEGGKREKQYTDRFLIYGDVKGDTTIVSVIAAEGSPGGDTGRGNDKGISIIQVSGQAHENSFRLEGDYITLDGKPYRYGLYAYGLGSKLGKADPYQKMVGNTDDFWDFRLESEYIEPSPAPEPPAPGPQPPAPQPPKPGPQPPAPPKPRPEPGVRAVVPQVSTYLLLPNALFQAGLMDINNQNKRLETMKTAFGGLLKDDEVSAFFVRGYGGNHRYISDLSALQYGYDGDLSYSAGEAGILLQAIENAYSKASLGIIGTYGRLSLQPLDVKQSQKSTFDKWSVTAYGGFQHDEGFYVDGLLSYGLFQGDVLTLARGKTATLKGNLLNASLSAGKMFMTSCEGLFLDPQAQIVYQYLHFDKARDIDNFDIEIGKLDQWVARIGGRLTKILNTTEEGRVISFYGKLNLSHSFGKKHVVHFKDAFQLGAFGSSLEAGVGFRAQLFPKLDLYGDLAYQHKLTKAGFLGTTFSGGLRYHF